MNSDENVFNLYWEVLDRLGKLIKHPADPASAPSEQMIAEAELQPPRAAARSAAIVATYSVYFQAEGLLGFLQLSDTAPKPEKTPRPEDLAIRLRFSLDENDRQELESIENAEFVITAVSKEHHQKVTVRMLGINEGTLLSVRAPFCLTRPLTEYRISVALANRLPSGSGKAASGWVPRPVVPLPFPPTAQPVGN